MSNLTMRNLKVITDHIERGIESGELSKGPAQGGKDAYAEATIKRLKGAATPLQAWANSSNASERPKKDELRSGSTHQNPDHGQRPRVSSQPAIPRTQPEPICSPHQDPDHGQSSQRSSQSAVPRTNTEAESKEQWSPESAYRSLPTSPYAPS